MSAQPILELAFDPNLRDEEVLERVRAGEPRLFEVRIYRAARARKLRGPVARPPAALHLEERRESR